MIERLTEQRVQLGVALCLIAVGVALRLVPHPPNFAPVAAIAIFGGAVLPRKLAVWVPLLAMMISDVIIGLHSLIAVTWGCYALIAFASSWWLARRPNLLRGVVLTLSGSLFFYIVTNFAVWAMSGMYPHTWIGLVNCYFLAIPFFRNTVLSDAVYTSALFALYTLAIYGSRRMAAHLAYRQVT